MPLKVTSCRMNLRWQLYSGTDDPGTKFLKNGDSDSLFPNVQIYLCSVFKKKCTRSLFSSGYIFDNKIDSGIETQDCISTHELHQPFGLTGPLNKVQPPHSPFSGSIQSWQLLQR